MRLQLGAALTQAEAEVLAQQWPCVKTPTPSGMGATLEFTSEADLHAARIRLDVLRSEPSPAAPADA